MGSGTHIHMHIDPILYAYGHMHIWKRILQIQLDELCDSVTVTCAMLDPVGFTRFACACRCIGADHKPSGSACSTRRAFVGGRSMLIQTAHPKTTHRRSAMLDVSLLTGFSDVMKQGAAWRRPVGAAPPQNNTESRCAHRACTFTV